jgi:hypothetical protein
MEWQEPQILVAAVAALVTVEIPSALAALALL